MRIIRARAWILLIALTILLTLTACVRPYPGSEASASQPTPVLPATDPVVVPQVPLETPVATVPAEVPVDVVEQTPIAVEPTAETAAETTHIVQAGDTLFSIALQYDVTVDEIAAANNITDVNSLEVGQQLIIPVPGSVADAVEQEVDQPDSVEESTVEAESEPTSPAPATAADGVHIVQPGENLYRIGLQYGCTVEQVARYNGIANPSRISVGQEIQIPECD